MIRIFSAQNLFDYVSSIIHQNYWNLSLTLARVSLALCTLLTLLFNSDGVLLLEVNESLNSKHIEYYSLFQIFGNIELSRYLAYFILIFVILGVYPFIFCVLHWWVAISFFISSPMIEGGDQIVSIFTLLLIPIFIFDKRKNSWRPSINARNNFYINTIVFLIFVCIRLQVFVIYFFSSVGKFAVTEWINGTAIYYWFNDPVFGLNKNLYAIFEPVLQNMYTVTFITWFVLLAELLIALAIFYPSKKFKIYMFWLGVFLHFSIAISFGLWSFMFAMIGVLLLALTDFNFKQHPKIVK